jgi:transcriptional regulator with XRE-family HTH domain
MKFTDALSDDAVLAELGARVARHRLERNLTQDALATEAGVSERTLIRVEHGRSTQAANLMRILRALGLTGNLDALIPEPPPSPIQQLKLHGRRRRRASPPAASAAPKKPWSWGDEP